MASTAPSTRARLAATPPTSTTSTLAPTRPPRLALRSGSAPVEVSSFRWPGLQDVEPQALGVTYWFAAAPYSVTVHISGRLHGKAPPSQRDTFAVLATVDDVVPGY